MEKIIKKLKILLWMLLLLLGLVGCSKKSKAYVYIKVTSVVNIEFVSSSNQYEVIAINGCDDEAKMILIDEDLIGMRVDEVVVNVIMLMIQHGYILSESVAFSPTEMEISILASEDKYGKIAIMKIDNAIANLLIDFSIGLSITINSNFSRDNLYEDIIMYHPIYSYISLDDLTVDHLMEVLINSINDKNEFIWTSISDYYQKIKKHRLYIMYREELMKDIQDEKTFNSYHYLNETIYNLLSDYLVLVEQTFLLEDGKYQLALREYYDAKSIVQATKTQIIVAGLYGEATVSLFQKLEQATMTMFACREMLEEITAEILYMESIIDEMIDEVYLEIDFLDQEFGLIPLSELRLNKVKIHYLESQLDIKSKHVSENIQGRLDEIKDQLREYKGKLKRAIIESNKR